MLIRIFPRRTRATPIDDFALTRSPNLLDYACDIDEVRVSVAFTYDIPKAEHLADSWRGITQNVTIGGPAYNDPGGYFVPGLYLGEGYVITSR